MLRRGGGGGWFVICERFGRGRRGSKVGGGK